MWGRVIEIMTAVWLMLSPFIFGASDNLTIMWVDYGTAMLIFCLSGVSYWRPLKYAHWAILLVAIALIIGGRFATPPPVSPAQQNHIFVGLFLLMIAIIPNEASQPPECWRRDMDVVTGGER